VRVFATVGYEEVRQRGSHIRLRHSSGARPPLTVPDHRELKTGLLHRLIRDAGMTVDEFVAAMK
jgi:predicted RNA binding protein YcfA (HicA-like mRNA interferase family)